MVDKVGRPSEPVFCGQHHVQSVESAEVWSQYDHLTGRYGGLDEEAGNRGQGYVVVVVAADEFNVFFVEVVFAEEFLEIVFGCCEQ